MNEGEISKIFVDLETGLRRFKQEWAMEALARIESRTPIDTGALQRGWGQTQRATGFDIWNTKDYAAYVEFGTPHHAPVGMISTTLVEADQISTIAKQRAGIK